MATIKTHLWWHHEDIFILTSDLVLVPCGSKKRGLFSLGVDQGLIACGTPLIIAKWKKALFFRKISQPSHRVPVLMAMPHFWMPPYVLVSNPIISWNSWHSWLCWEYAFSSIFKQIYQRGSRAIEIEFSTSRFYLRQEEDLPANTLCVSHPTYLCLLFSGGFGSSLCDLASSICQTATQSHLSDVIGGIWGNPWWGWQIWEGEIW